MQLVRISAAVLIHALLIYAFLNGLGTQTFSVIKELPIEAELIEEVKLPAPPRKVMPPTPLTSLPQVRVPKVTSPLFTHEVINVPPPPSEMLSQAVAVNEYEKSLPNSEAMVDFSTCDKPNYPRDSLRNEEQGTVRIQFLIGLDGHVADSRIETSSGFRSLDAAAKKALSLCKFIPAMIDGKPQRSRTVVSYIWKLPD